MTSFAGHAIRHVGGGCRVIAGGVAHETGTWIALGFPCVKKNGICTSPAMRASQPCFGNILVTVDTVLIRHVFIDAI